MTCCKPEENGGHFNHAYRNMADDEHDVIVACCSNLMICGVSFILLLEKDGIQCGYKAVPT